MKGEGEGYLLCILACFLAHRRGIRTPTGLGGVLLAER